MVVMLDDRRQFSSWTTFWWCPVLDAYNKVKNDIKPTKEICDNHKRDSVVEQWQYLQQYVKKGEDISKPKMKTSLMYLDDIYLLFFD